MANHADFGSFLLVDLPNAADHSVNEILHRSPVRRFFFFKC
jgi:hypothetical protein